MKIFYGSSIQGVRDRGSRAHIHKILIEFIKNKGFTVPFEHTSGRNTEEVTELLDKSIGPLPPLGIQRTIYVRRKIIEVIEGDIIGSIFEVSTPALGTGIEIAHAYLRPRIGLQEIPILLLYQKDYWPNKLSSMIRGITKDEVPCLVLVEYTNLEGAKSHISEFLKNIII